MMHHKAIRTLGSVGVGMLLVACAGGDTPPRSSELVAAIADVHGDGSPSGSAGSTGGAGPSNGGSTNNGGSGNPSNGGSDDGGDGGSDVAMGGSDPVGGGGSGEPAECDGFAILQSKCGSAGCHGANSPYSGFAESEGAAADFVDADPATAACSSDGPIFDPAAPDNSLVVRKISSAPCGSPMPLGGAVSAEELACIEEFIGTL